MPFIILPNGPGGPLYRRITSEDLAKWREAYKSHIRVVIGKGRGGLIPVSELTNECKASASKIISVTQQQGYAVLGWGQYQKLLNEISNLISAYEEQAITTRPTQATGTGLALPTTHSLNR